MCWTTKYSPGPSRTGGIFLRRSMDPSSRLAASPGMSRVGRGPFASCCPFVLCVWLPFSNHGPAASLHRRILLFPSGNNVDQCSVYLEHGFDAAAVPEDWSCCVQFALVLWNPNNPSIYSHHAAHHRFTKEEGDWGFTRFMELRKMFNSWESGATPLVENDTANITAYVRVVEDETGVLWHNFANYDSKKETGFVGLKNQGATCYLNSLLQSLYFTNAFRKVGLSLTAQDEFSSATC